MNNYIIFAGGPINDVTHIRSFLKDAPYIICADGGARHLIRLDIEPNKLIGDLDSIDADLLEQYKTADNVEVIHAPDQNSTDLEKALKLIPDDAQRIDIFGALGGRMDHQLANIFTLEKHHKPNRFCIHDEQNEVRLLTEDYHFTGNIGDKVGIIPLRDIKNLSFAGLKFSAEGLSGDFALGWLGTSNELIEDKASIKIDSGLAIFTLYREK